MPGVTSFVGSRWIGVAPAVLCLAAAMSAQEPPPAPNGSSAPVLADTQIDWVTGYPEAVRLSRESKRPLFVAFNMDKDIGNEEMVKNVYCDKRVVERSRFFVCVMCSVFVHEEQPGVAGHPECKRFGRVSCAEHKQCEIKASDALIGTDVVIAPQHVICYPDGRLLERRAWQMTDAELIRMLNNALRAAGAPGAPPPPDPKVELKQIADLIEQAEKAVSYRKDEPIQQIAELATEGSRRALEDYARKGKNDETRVACISVLGQKGDYLSLETLRKVAKDGKSNVALAAVDALGRTELPNVKEDLKKLLSAFPAGNDYGRVLRAYAVCAKDDPAARTLVVKQARGTDQNIKTHALMALVNFEPNPEIDECLKRALKDPVNGTRACAAWAIGTGQFKECRAELEHFAANESAADLKSLAADAVRHFDHPKNSIECCSLYSRIYSFVNLWNSR